MYTCAPTLTLKSFLLELPVISHLQEYTIQLTSELQELVQLGNKLSEQNALRVRSRNGKWQDCEAEAHEPCGQTSRCHPWDQPSEQLRAPTGTSSSFVAMNSYGEKPTTPNPARQFRSLLHKPLESECAAQMWWQSANLQICICVVTPADHTCICIFACLHICIFTWSMIRCLHAFTCC